MCFESEGSVWEKYAEYILHSVWEKNGENELWPDFFTLLPLFINYVNKNVYEYCF